MGIKTWAHNLINNMHVLITPQHKHQKHYWCLLNISRHSQRLSSLSIHTILALMASIQPRVCQLHQEAVGGEDVVLTIHQGTHTKNYVEPWNQVLKHQYIPPPECHWIDEVVLYLPDLTKLYMGSKTSSGRKILKELH
ncbi:hypothetical protein VP01_1079g1 [Puccinia sorghi]|uniref:Uncharacterized protein n=1 Tax=Puccinia sorghi TaxID=27349 RepID=A0A0L6VTE9_9BASI|nr:hypothetical protein VP01_1079g1 [Puccinia sorghi]